MQSALLYTVLNLNNFLWLDFFTRKVLLFLISIKFRVQWYIIWPLLKILIKQRHFLPSWAVSGQLTMPETGTVEFFESPWYTYNKSKVRPCMQWLAYETHPSTWSKDSKTYAEAYNSIITRKHLLHTQASVANKYKWNFKEVCKNKLSEKDNKYSWLLYTKNMFFFQLSLRIQFLNEISW